MTTDIEGMFLRRKAVMLLISSKAGMCLSDILKSQIRRGVPAYTYQLAHRRILEMAAVGLLSLGKSGKGRLSIHQTEIGADLADSFERLLAVMNKKKE